LLSIAFQKIAYAAAAVVLLLLLLQQFVPEPSISPSNSLIAFSLVFDVKSH
jgi:hypothetical protein